MSDKTYKLRVSYTVEITAQQRKDLLAYGDSMGHSHDNPKPLTLLKRVFQAGGEDVILRAQEDAHMNRQDNDDEP